MLQWMRRLSKSWISSLFLGMLALSFAVWGIADVFRGNVSDTVVTVGGQPVSSAEFKIEYDKFVKRYAEQTNQQITPEQARAMGMPQATLDQMIARMALDNYARKLGLTVSDADVSAEIQSDRTFAGPLGTFDKPTFDRVMQINNLTEKRYIESVRGDMIRQQLLGAVEDGFQMPDSYLLALFASGNERRAVEYVVLTPESQPVAPPSDAVLAAYVKAHPERYSTPEYRDVSFAWLTPADVANQVSVTPAQIAQAYDAQSATFIVPEKRTLEQINFPNQADAAAARAKIDKGESFAQVAAERGLKPTDIAIGDHAQSELDKDIGAAAFAAPVNGVTQPVKSAFGYALVHVVAITQQGHTTTLAEATPQIKAQLLAQLESAKLTDIANAYSEELGGGAEVQEAAAKAGMHFGHVAAIDANGLGPDGKPVAAPIGSDVRTQIFKADVGDAGDPFSTKDGAAYAIKVNGVVPPKLKPLDQVRAEATAAWIAEQQQARLAVEARALAAQATKAQSMGDVAKAANATVQTSQALDRRANDATFSPALTAAIFDAAPGAAVSGPLGKGAGFVVARVTGIAHPNYSADNPILTQGRQIIAGQMASDVGQSFAAAERARQHAVVDNKLLNQAVGLGEGS
jgi:peptidyl-prolyl cis-trans isomerase D